MPKSEKDAVVYLVIGLVCFIGAFAAPQVAVTVVLVFAAFLLLVTGSLGYIKHSRTSTPSERGTSAKDSR